MTEDEIRENLNKIADLLAKQEWAKIIPEIPQSELHYLKNKNRVSAYAEEGSKNEESTRTTD